MTRLKATIVAAAFLLLGLLWPSYAFASQKDHESALPASAKSPLLKGLQIEIRNAVAEADRAVYLDLEMFNRSEAPIILVERWNSWGAYQWSFHVVDAAGTIYELINPQTAWFRNAYTTFEIAPQKSFVMRCRLELDGYKPLEKVDNFSVGLSVANVTKRPWEFPLRISARFVAKMQTRHPGSEPERAKATHWAGSLETGALAVSPAPNKALNAGAAKRGAG